MCIIDNMERNELIRIINDNAGIIWDNLCELYPRLLKYNPPVIILNNRLWRNAGLSHQESNIIELGYKFFIYSTDYYYEMINIILPHEIIHQADYNLFGLSEAKCGHGKKWREIMINYGLEDNKYHSMEIKR